MNDAYDVICSIGELIDKLSIENIKCYNANQRILEERKQANPSSQAIADLEWQARSSGERRVKIRDEINRRINEAIQRGRIQVANEARTYDLNGVSND